MQKCGKIKCPYRSVLTMTKWIVLWGVMVPAASRCCLNSEFSVKMSKALDLKCHEAIRWSVRGELSWRRVVQSSSSEIFQAEFSQNIHFPFGVYKITAKEKNVENKCYQVNKRIKGRARDTAEKLDLGQWSLFGSELEIHLPCLFLP